MNTLLKCVAFCLVASSAWAGQQWQGQQQFDGKIVVDQAQPWLAPRVDTNSGYEETGRIGTIVGDARVVAIFFQKIGSKDQSQKKGDVNAQKVCQVWYNNHNGNEFKFQGDALFNVPGWCNDLVYSITQNLINGVYGVNTCRRNCATTTIDDSTVSYETYQPNYQNQNQDGQYQGGGQVIDQTPDDQGGAVVVTPAPTPADNGGGTVTPPPSPNGGGVDLDEDLGDWLENQ